MNPAERAEEYLKSEGIRVLDRAWKSAEGTIDIVASDSRAVNTLVVVVLQNTGTARVPSKGALKRQRRMAVAWMHAHGTRYTYVRVDVVSVRMLPMDQSNLEHMRAVDKGLY